MKLLSIPELASILGLSTEALRMRIYREPDEYPPLIRLGKRTVRFEEQTVQRWLKSKNALGEKHFPSH